MACSGTALPFYNLLSSFSLTQLYIISGVEKPSLSKVTTITKAGVFLVFIVGRAVAQVLGHIVQLTILYMPLFYHNKLTVDSFVSCHNIHHYNHGNVLVSVLVIIGDTCVIGLIQLKWEEWYVAVKACRNLLTEQNEKK
jgi:hypothetical protein